MRLPLLALAVLLASAAAGTVTSDDDHVLFRSLAVLDLMDPVYIPWGADHTGTTRRRTTAIQRTVDYDPPLLVGALLSFNITDIPYEGVSKVQNGQEGGLLTMQPILYLALNLAGVQQFFESCTESWVRGQAAISLVQEQPLLLCQATLKLCLRW
jgi:hypothetical protein